MNERKHETKQWLRKHCVRVRNKIGIRRLDLEAANELFITNFLSPQTTLSIVGPDKFQGKTITIKSSSL